ncbi:MAG: hybrid sensor histidine kinase/response regulator [Deltaproteobacteria bacterium]|nr:hybrid sensor histidine kinase/response regulator [Deltaproteobacteria bacterium]
MNDRAPLILVIDDEEPLRDGCKQTLERSGYVVMTAGNGDEGINLAREHKPDLAFIDLKMPGMSGMEIIDILYRDIPDIVLIMITGYAAIDSAVEAIKKGAYDYLPKPFSPDQLRTVTRRGLDYRGLKIEARHLREDKERMEKAFITFVSHEMRSPLVVVQQSIESIKIMAGDRLGADVKEVIERCETRVQRLQEMIEHWLDISRVEGGNIAQNKVPLSLAGIIAKSAEEMAPVCQAKGITLEIHAPDDLKKINGDEESLVRVFTNIIGNATKYTPEGGKITVSARADEHYANVAISDTGKGIPPDKLPFIFDPFYRVKGKQEVHQGSGLGLTFCKRIMDAHNGKIEALSKEGEGTTIMLKFPF